MNTALHPELNKKQRLKGHRKTAMTFGLVAILALAALSISVWSKERKTSEPYIESHNSTPTNSDQSSTLSLPKSPPSRLLIGEIGVDAPVIELGLQKNGTIEVPVNGEDVGWYKYGPTPGEIGSSVIVGHLDTPQGAAVFYKLKELDTGDTIRVKRNDGKIAIFEVRSKETFSQDNFPTLKVYAPTKNASLKLVTCEGIFLESAGHYSDNLVVFADLVKVE